MRKILSFCIAAALCLSLGACGSAKNSDHDYILSLLERGEYDKAIRVIEILRDGAEGTQTQSAQTTATEAAAVQTTAADTAATETTVPQTAAADTAATQTAAMEGPVAGATDREKLAADTVKTFLENTGDAAIKQYEDVIAKKARPTTVTHAMEYRLGNWDGKGTNAHCMLIWLSADVVWDNSAYDSVQILLEMDTGKNYDSLNADWNLIDACGGDPTNKEEFNTIALNAYHSYVLYGEEQMWTEWEIREEFSDSELAAINEALK